MRLISAAEMVGKSAIIHLAWVMRCYVSGIEVNDVSEIKAAKESQLITLKTLEVPAGVTLKLTNLLPGTVIEFDGTLTFGYSEWKGPLIRIWGRNITIVGKPGHLIDCQGDRWWDGQGSNNGKIKPKFFELNVTDSTVTGLNVKNTPVHAFSIRNCSNVRVTGVKIDNSEGDAKGARNTDGFDVNSRNVQISDCWVHNQDDCLAVNSGSDLVFEDNVCIGGHGISIGSIGFRANNVVERILVKHCDVIDSTNGIRIKAKTGAVGWIDKVTFEDVLLKNIKGYGILFHTNYHNAEQKNMGDEPTPGVPITHLRVSNVRGTVLSKGTNIYVAVANASEWTWDHIDITGGNKKRDCQGVPPEVDAICGK